MNTRALTPLITFLATVAIAPRAGAATFEVSSCGYRPGGGADNAWQFVTNAPGYLAQAPDGCTTAGQTENSGLVAREVWGNTAVPSGSRQEFRLTSPTGTTISKVQIWRYVQQWNASGWLLYGRKADGTYLESNQPYAGSASLGSWASGGDVTFAGLATDSIAWGVVCNVVSGTCIRSTGTYGSYTLHTGIYRSKVTITDNTAPTAGDVSGAILGGGWLTGTTVSAAVQAGTDSTGIKQTRVRIDGTVVATNNLTCDYSRATDRGGVMTVDPCPHPSSPTTTSVPISGLAEGSHQVRAETVDAAGNSTLGPAYTITIDNTAPTAPQMLQPSYATTSRQAAITWGAPDAGTGSPIAAIKTMLCSSTGACDAPQDHASTATGTTVTVPTDGDWTVKAWAVDTAGNSSASAPSTTTILASAPTPPGGGGTDAPSTPTTPAPPTTKSPTGGTTTSSPSGATNTQSTTTTARKDKPATDGEGGDAAADSLVSPHLRILMARRSGRTITVRGTVDDYLEGIRATVTVTRGKRTRRYTRQLAGGRFSIRLTVPPGRGSITVRIATPKTDGYRAATVARRVK